MAKRIRAARHYQRKDAAVRLLAEHAKPAVRKDLREAFSHLGSLVPTAQVLHFARAGDWNNLKRAINWSHYREVLKAPFGRLVKLRQAGAELGVQKINGTFAQARRQVRFRKGEDRWWVHKYSENQPRDEHGRWTRGEGLSSSEKEISVGGKNITIELSQVDRRMGEKLVEINVAAFDANFASDTNFYIGPGGKMDTGEISGRYGRFQDYLASHNRMEASTVGVQSDGRVGFTNGRHRYAVLRDMGVSHMPVAMDKESIKLAEKYGYLHISKVFDLFDKDIGSRFNFDILDQATQDRIRDAQDELIQQLETSARDAIDTIVISGAQEGLGAEDIVSDIRAMIGLTDRQAQAVMNYERMLRDLDPGALARQLRNFAYDEEVQAAIDAGEDLADAAVDSMVADYIDNYLDYRAETIAQTETVRAANMGLQDAYQQAIDRGALPFEAVKQYWQVALDEKTCEICLSCADLNEDGVAIGEPFDSIDGPMDAPPDPHPACRCSLELVTDLDLVPEEQTQ